MALDEREQLAAMEDDVGVRDAAIGRDVGRSVRQLAAEAAEQCASGVVLGLPFRGADPAVAIAGAAVLEMEACSMPSPTNQCAPGTSNCGLGPLRYSVPFNSRGSSPVIFRNGASASNGIGARLDRAAFEVT